MVVLSVYYILYIYVYTLISMYVDVLYLSPPFFFYLLKIFISSMNSVAKKKRKRFERREKGNHVMDHFVVLLCQDIITLLLPSANWNRNVCKKNFNCIHWISPTKSQYFSFYIFTTFNEIENTLLLNKIFKLNYH